MHIDTNTLTAYGISQAIYEILENSFTFDEETGEIIFTTDDLEALQDALDSKLDSLAGVVQLLEDTKENYKKRQAKLTEEINVIDNKIQKTKNFLKYLLEVNGVEKTKYYGTHRIGFRRSQSVNISDEEKLTIFLESQPQYKETCVKTEQKTSFIKPGIKQLLKDGVEIPGATIIEKKEVVIK